MNMTTAQRNKLLTILHLHRVTHGQDVSDLVALFTPSENRSITAEEVTAAVEKVTRIGHDMICHRSRDRRYSDARHLMCGMIHRYCEKMTKTELGRYIRRDRTTALHSLRQFDWLSEKDVAFRAKVEEVEKILAGN